MVAPCDCEADTLTFSLAESTDFDMIEGDVSKVPVNLTMSHVCRQAPLTTWVAVCPVKGGDHREAAEGTFG
jgi:hypothetical protein